jgi:AraC family carnitine catabolism transcriptional activator
LQQTNLSVTEVAVSAGFGSLEHFSRVYRSVFGRAPSTDRRQVITAPVYRRLGAKANAEGAARLRGTAH